MPIALKVDEFVTINPLTGEKFLSGLEFVQLFGFNPNTCTVVIYGDILRVWQEGVNPVQTTYWRQTLLAE